MARKQAVKKSSGRRSGGAKRTVRKKTVRKQAGSRASSGTKTPVKKRSPAAGQRKRVTKKARSLGRPRIPADARLDLVFQKDYQAREVFDFLRVESIRELEQFGPAEIIEKLTAPMVQTVQRIRKALALCNRCLAQDQEFAAAFKAEFAGR